MKQMPYLTVGKNGMKQKPYVGMVADESCRKFKKGTNFSENLHDYMKIGEKI